MPWQLVVRRAGVGLAMGGLVATIGCSETTRFTTETVLTVNQVEGLGSDARMVYVATGLEASLHASRQSEEAMSLASRAMDVLVAEAAKQAGNTQSWALVNVTLEEGTFATEAGDERVVTLRGDVVAIRGAAP